VQDEEEYRWNDQELEVRHPTHTAMMDQSTVLQIRSQLQAISMEEKSQLADKMGVGEDFSQA
jgi:hypothetical protein